MSMPFQQFNLTLFQNWELAMGPQANPIGMSAGASWGVQSTPRRSLLYRTENTPKVQGLIIDPAFPGLRKTLVCLIGPLGRLNEVIHVRHLPQYLAHSMFSVYVGNDCCSYHCCLQWSLYLMPHLVFFQWTDALIGQLISRHTWLWQVNQSE